MLLFRFKILTLFKACDKITRIITIVLEREKTMLHKITKAEYDRYIDMIYAISADLFRSAFPIYADGVKDRALFYSKSMNGLNRDDEEILLYENNSEVLGWVHYYFIESDKYIGISSMLIKKNFGKALRELFEYWGKRFTGYSWCFYLPSENREALDFMAENGFSEISEEIVDVLLFKDYVSGTGDENVIEINMGNFELFENIHRQYENEMYWTSERIKKALDKWRVFAYVKEGNCLQALYYVRSGKDFEIFGIDGAEENNDPESDRYITEKLLVSGLNTAKADGAESMYFFNDEKTHITAEKLGFKKITEAICFEGKI